MAGGLALVAVGRVFLFGSEAVRVVPGVMFLFRRSGEVFIDFEW